MASRRLLLAGAAGALLAFDGRRLRAAPADPAPPWAAAPPSSHPDWRVRAGHWAVLAPNPHNRQPWVLDLQADGAALLRCDLDRRLPATDPFDRQITIGLGAFAELFRMAAAAEGRRVVIEPFPEGVPVERLDARPVARLAPRAGGTMPDPLFAHVLARRSAKVPFDTARTVGADALATIAAATGPGFAATSDAPRVAALRDLTWRAWVVEAQVGTPVASTKQQAPSSIGLQRSGEQGVFGYQVLLKSVAHSAWVVVTHWKIVVPGSW